MMIQGKLEEYMVRYRPVGFTYAAPVIRAKRSIWFLPVSRWKEVSEGRAKCILTVKRMYPDEMRKWFQAAVDDHEAYVTAWRSWESGCV